MKGYKELNWKTAKGMMSDPNFLRSLMEIDFDSITQGQVKNIRSACGRGRKARLALRGQLSLGGRDGEPGGACRRQGGMWPCGWRGSGGRWWRCSGKQDRPVSWHSGRCHLLRLPTGLVVPGVGLTPELSSCVSCRISSPAGPWRGGCGGGRHHPRPAPDFSTECPPRLAHRPEPWGGGGAGGGTVFAKTARVPGTTVLPSAAQLCHPAHFCRHLDTNQRQHKGFQPQKPQSPWVGERERPL